MNSQLRIVGGGSVKENTDGKNKLIQEILGEETVASLNGTSLASVKEQSALCRMPKPVRELFIHCAQNGQKVSAVNYFNLERNHRINPLIQAAYKATEEELFHFLNMLTDPENSTSREIWSAAEVNTIERSRNTSS